MILGQLPSTWPYSTCSCHCFMRPFSINFSFVSGPSPLRALAVLDHGASVVQLQISTCASCRDEDYIIGSAVKDPYLYNCYLVVCFLQRLYLVGAQVQQLSSTLAGASPFSLWAPLNFDTSTMTEPTGIYVMLHESPSHAQ